MAARKGAQEAGHCSVLPTCWGLQPASHLAPTQGLTRISSSASSMHATVGSGGTVAARWTSVSRLLMVAAASKRSQQPGPPPRTPTVVEGAVADAVHAQDVGDALGKAHLVQRLVCGR